MSVLPSLLPWYNNLKPELQQKYLETLATQRSEAVQRSEPSKASTSLPRASARPIVLPYLSESSSHSKSSPTDHELPESLASTLPQQREIKSLFVSSPLPNVEQSDATATTIQPQTTYGKPQVAQSRSHNSSPRSLTFHSRNQEDAMPTDSMSTVTKLAPINGPQSIFSGRELSKIGAQRIPKSTLTGLKRKATDDNPANKTDEAHIANSKIPSQSSATSSINAKPASQNAQALRGKYPFPDWYNQTDVGPRAKYDRTLLVSVTRPRDLITKLKKAATAADRQTSFGDIRTHLQQVQYLNVNAVIIKKSKLLDPIDGLPQLFAPEADLGSIPFDIVADSKALYRKWCRMDFNPDMMRGIIYGKKDSGSRAASKLDPNYPSRMGANVFGENDLVNGAWWPLLLCALRDGAHGSAQAGIHGQKGKGAFSILVSGSHYEDEDHGDVILYTGTEGSEGEKKEATERLFENIKFKNPVRVLRSASLPADNIYRPALGFRYDGLYDVIGSELLDERKAHYRFRLERQMGQDPIRYGQLYARPSAQDVEAYNNHKGIMK